MNVTQTDMATVLALAEKPGATLCTHSGEAGKGDIFVSLPKAASTGLNGPDYTDAQQYLTRAVCAGVSHIICTQSVFDAAGVEEAATGPLGVTVVDDPRTALGELAKAHYKTDRSSIGILGITGTNGKTTSTYLLEAIVKAAGKTPGVVGTVEYRWPGHEEVSPLTTPDCLRLHSMLASMWAAGVDTAIMELSSHSIDQNRVAGLSFAGAIFTNLTQDHLDYHRDMEDYFSAKAKLFTSREKGGLASLDTALVVNLDDTYGERLFVANDAIIGFSLQRGGDRVVHGTILEQGRDGLHLRMAYAGDSWELRSPLVGAFNAANLMGVQALTLALGFGRKPLQALESFAGVPGRLERVNNPQGLSIFVDYAHTPDALQKALQALRGAKFERIVTVFGCGGNRDRTKRPLMGKTAATLSDVVVVTSDNPRREDCLAILADIRLGLGGARNVIEEVDRKKAIGLALDVLKPGDALLIAGKGHEPYQIIGDTKYPFSDQQVVREYLGCV